MIAQCWLHIGTEKTGSTSLQRFFAHNRSALRARGWLYPAAAGVRNHYSLVAYGLDDDRHDRTRQMFGIGERVSLEAFRRQLTGAIEAECATSGADVVLLSNELLATRLRHPAEVARLKGLCDRLAQQTKVIVYLRNQVDYLVSRYTNIVWEGGTAEFKFRAGKRSADYKLLLHRWAEVFGRENIVVRRFEPSDFPDGDVIADFARTTGLDAEGFYRPPRANPSLDAQSLAFLRAVNRRLPQALAERVRPWRGAIVRVLQRRRGGMRFVIPPGLARKIENTYRDSNEQVSAAYFDSRYRPLFSPASLVSADDRPPPGRIGPITTVRIGGFLVLGLLRDRLTRAARHLF